MKRLLLLAFLASPAVLFANLQDTVIRVKSVSIKHKRINQAKGFKKERIAPEVLKLEAHTDLSQLISENTPIYVKNYGQNGISTVSFRGTNATHTQVNWNGIPLNSISLGQFDFSLIPSFLVDEVAISYGGSSLEHGSGAFGGSVDLSNGSPVKSGIHKASASYGSTHQSALFYQGETQSGAFANRIRVFGKYNKNDFRYTNKFYAKNPITGRRQHAAYYSFGLMNEAKLQLNSHQHLLLNIWAQQNHRELPKSFLVGDSREQEMQNFNLRNLLTHKWFIGANKWENSLAFLHETMEFSSRFTRLDKPATVSLSHSNTLHYKSDYSLNDLSDGMKIKLKLDNKYDFLISKTHTQEFLSRNLLSGALSLEYAHLDWASFSALLRQDVQDQELATPTFATGADFRLVPARNYFLKLNFSRNIKRPSLNDLYYYPSGNPDLLPESGFNTELGLSLEEQLNSNWLVEMHLSGYRMEVENWIIWKPEGPLAQWRPENYKRVISQGAESFLKLKQQVGDFSQELTTNYTFTSSVNKTEAENVNDNSQGKQLIYVPKHKWNMRYLLQLNGVTASYNLNFVGRRFIQADEGDWTTAYIIHDAAVSYRFAWGSTHHRLQFRVDNLANTLYSSIAYFPMPLRQFLVSWGVDL